MKICPQCGEKYPDTSTLCPSDGTALEKEGDSLLGQTLAGKYRIDERLNEGGMGTVYRGTHVLMDKTVAIKVLRPALAADEKIVARFSREARAASRISHPHALSVTDFGEAEGGIVFLVMEFLSGRTLKDVIRQEAPLPLSRIVEIVRQVGGALEEAHCQGVVHRDLKSDNIMLLSAGGADYAKVLDFGIAKIREPIAGYDPGITAPDLVIGTPQYMSPEQCSQAAELDARSDVYSLGVILFEMFVGHVPFTGDSSTAIMLKHLQQPPPSVLEERSDLPAAAARVVSRAMAKRPEERYQSARELVEDLTTASDTEVTAGSSLVSERGPNRIVVPTQSVSMLAASGMEPDEETVVRPRGMAPASGPASFKTRPIIAPASFNPWRIVVPAFAGVLFVFAVIYAFTRNSEPASTNTDTNANISQPGTTLSTDPNSQPVEPAQPATGANEQGIPSEGSSINQAAGLNANVNPSVSPSPVSEGNLNSNTGNENTESKSNNNRQVALPSPPVPRREVNANELPRAISSPTQKAPEPKPAEPTTETPPSN
jgi:eukaryotic-like serine/threonine-protein kinase